MLYTEHVYFFQAAGMILLVAMIGAIVLTLRHKPGVKRQDISEQNARTREDSDARSARSPRGRACEERAMIGLGHYLTVAAILFTIGIFGIFLNRKNVIVILMSVELILLAVNINLVAFSSFLGDLTGQVFALFVLTVAAAEAAIGLAILVIVFPQPRLHRGRRHQYDEGLSGMYTAIVFLPLLGFLIAGLFGRQIGARASEIVTTSADVCRPRFCRGSCSFRLVTASRR